MTITAEISAVYPARSGRTCRFPTLWLHLQPLKSTSAKAYFHKPAFIFQTIIQSAVYKKIFTEKIFGRFIGGPKKATSRGREHLSCYSHGTLKTYNTPIEMPDKLRMPYARRPAVWEDMRYRPVGKVSIVCWRGESVSVASASNCLFRKNFWKTLVLRTYCIAGQKWTHNQGYINFHPQRIAAAQIPCFDFLAVD